MIPTGAETSLTLQFGPGRYVFELPMKAIVEVERLCEKALGVVYDELSAAVGVDRETEATVYLVGGPARIRDCYHVIRVAAQYGGEAEISGEVVKVSALDATRLVEQSVDGRPYGEFVPVAWAIIRSTLLGVNVKKKGEAQEDTSLSTGAA